MLHGYNTDPKTTTVVSAHTEVEFRNWYQLLMQETSAPLYKEQREIDVFEFLMNDGYEGLKTSVYEFKFSSIKNQEAFIKEHKIIILPRLNAIDRNQDMNYRSNDNYDTDQRTIGEITGTDINDPWDTTSDEDKAAAKALKDMMKQRQKDDEVSNDDSFSTPNQGGVHVQSISTSVDEHGKVVVDAVGAVKLTGDEIQRSQEEIERVKKEEYDKGRPEVLKQAVVKDLSKQIAKIEGKPKTAKKA